MSVRPLQEAHYPMRTIRATCPLCTDEVDLRPGQITLHLVDQQSDASYHGSRYGFECPTCEVFVVKPAGANAVELLLEGGVSLSTDTVAPWEKAKAHPENPPAGAPFTADDVLDLHLLLQSEHWFDDLVATLR
jgi:hypothetical protein